MKNLKDYIKDYIVESVWDIEDNIESDNKEFILANVKRFIDNNYLDNMSRHCEYIFDENQRKYIVNCKRDIIFKAKAECLTDGTFKWGTVGGWFDCSNCPITSLEGAPEEVGMTFDCHKCTKLKSLKGAPETVGDNFNCSNCNKLKTLEGAPKKVGGDFDCRWCTNLKSLKGAPEYVGENFDCHECPKLETLQGGPEKVGGAFSCCTCPELTSLEGAPKEVGGDFWCTECDNLKSLDGIGKVGGKIKQVKDRYDY